MLFFSFLKLVRLVISFFKDKLNKNFYYILKYFYINIYQYNLRLLILIAHIIKIRYLITINKSTTTKREKCVNY